MLNICEVCSGVCSVYFEQVNVSRNGFRFIETICRQFWNDCIELVYSYVVNLPIYINNLFL